MSWHVPDDLAWVLDEHVDGELDVHLMHVPDGLPILLTGTAAAIWLLAVKGEDVLEGLRHVVTDPPPDLEQITTAFLAELQERGLVLATPEEDVTR